MYYKRVINQLVIEANDGPLVSRITVRRYRKNNEYPNISTFDSRIITSFERTVGPRFYVGRGRKNCSEVRDIARFSSEEGLHNYTLNFKAVMPFSGL
jgi:hypothetical protein